MATTICRGDGTGPLLGSRQLSASKTVTGILSSACSVEKVTKGRLCDGESGVNEASGGGVGI